MALALTASTLAQDVFAQYHHARPWIILESPDLLTPSTLMPQKRNPVALGRVRLLASEVLGDGVRSALVGHNVAPGVTDYKRYDAADTLQRAAEMLAELQAVVAGIRVDADAAAAELAAEFATASHAAVVLERRAGIGAAQAHAVASAIVVDARRDGVGSSGLDAERVRAAFAAVTGAELDAAVAEAVRAAFTPAEMVAGARGLGGPQPAEVVRMRDVAQRRLEADAAAFDATQTGLATADAARDAALRVLAAR
jgi:argininosuccinate lyase